MTNEQCVCCKSKNLISVLDLGNQPWCNDFITEEQKGNEKIYPLNLFCCQDCYFLQLGFFVPKEVMFYDHSYLSGTTKTLRDHFSSEAERNIRLFKLEKDDLVIDIGGNDGTALLEYKKRGLKNLINIESCVNIADIARNNGIRTISRFFNERLCCDEDLQDAKAKLIRASGVFFHLEEIHSVLRGIQKVLDEEGVLYIQFMYVVDMIKNLSFDMIYHEHLYYYTIQSLEKLVKPYGLSLALCNKLDIHSGSVEAYFVRDTSRQLQNLKKKNKNTALLKQEIDFLGINPIKKYQEFGERVLAKKNDLRNLLATLKGKKVYGLGAPAKGNTLLNFFGIDNSLVQKLHEINDLKIGKYTASTHIPIEKENENDLPDYYLVLAHNFFDEIIKKNQKMRDKDVKFILPFPEIKIV
jgi:hypothetical protein